MLFSRCFVYLKYSCMKKRAKTCKKHAKTCISSTHPSKTCISSTHLSTKRASSRSVQLEVVLLKALLYVTRKIYVLIENNPIIRTYCNKMLNFHICISYDLNKVCRNIYTYGAYNKTKSTPLN